MQAVLASVLIAVCLGSNAMEAQQGRMFELITRGRKQGTVRGATFRVPADATFVTFVVNLSQQEVNDDTLSLRYRPLWQPTPGGDLVPFSGWVEWQGGVPGAVRPGQTFSITEGAPGTPLFRDYRGKRVTIEIDIPKELQVEVLFLPDQEHPDIQ